MEHSTILVVEDNIDDKNRLIALLEEQKYCCLTSNGGKAAIMKTASQNPDILLIDLDLSDLDGIEVIKKIRTWSHVPIIVVSERGSEDDKVAALDAGADDYMTKPFSEKELLARIRTTQRRLGIMNTGDYVEAEFRNGELKIDYASGCVYIGNSEVHVTPIEFKLLCLLSKHIGKVLPHRYIIEHIWVDGEHHDVSALRVFMANLRKKMEKGEHPTSYIQTQVGVGYRMVNVDEA